jgi:hypothetical protein
MNENIEYRRNQLPKDFKFPIQTLSSVELHVSEPCTRRCSFCPHGKEDFKHSGQYMSVDTAQIIAMDLKTIGFRGRLGLSGFGEPLLNPHLWNICWKLHNCTSSLEIVTNGDLLTKDVIEDLYRAGVDLFTINRYDEDDSERFKEMFKGWKEETYRIRVHPQGDGLILNNRAGALYEAENVSRPCYLPFYKLMIDHDGSYLMCSNDWQRDSKTTLHVRNTSIQSFWLGAWMDQYRLMLMNGQRRTQMCQDCDCDGMLVGKEQFECWSRYYEETS